MMESMISLGKFYFFVIRTRILDLFHNGNLFIYSFVCMIISISDLLSMCKIQKIFLLSNETRKAYLYTYEIIN